MGAESAGHVVGVIMGAWDGRRGWLHHLVAHSDYRRMGMTTALLSAVEAQLEAKGCLKVNLLVREDSADARRPYSELRYEDMTSILLVGKEL